MASENLTLIDTLLYWISFLVWHFNSSSNVCFSQGSETWTIEQIFMKLERDIFSKIFGPTGIPSCVFNILWTTLNITIKVWSNSGECLLRQAGVELGQAQSMLGTLEITFNFRYCPQLPPRLSPDFSLNVPSFPHAMPKLPKASKWCLRSFINTFQFGRVASKLG